jgi:hypothetical protein
MYLVSAQELLSWITIDPRVMVGKPAIKGARLTVEFVGLAPEAISACLLLASHSLRNPKKLFEKVSCGPGDVASGGS